MDIERRWRTHEQGAAAVELDDTAIETSSSAPEHGLTESPEQPPEAPAHSPDDQIVVLDGRSIRICLEDLAHVGHQGTPTNMIGSGPSAFVHGSIEVHEANVPATREPAVAAAHTVAPLPLPPQLEAPKLVLAPIPDELEAPTTPDTEAVEQGGVDDLDLEWRDPRRRRVTVAVIALAVSVVVGALLHALDSRQATAEPEPSATPLHIPSTPIPQVQEEIVEPLPTPSTGDEPELGPDPGPGPRGPESGPASDPAPPTASRAASAHDSSPCRRRRDKATQARKAGRWQELDELAGKRSCWHHPGQAKALQLQALFELGEFERCIQLAADSRAKEVKTWKSNCQRALD